jgi:hypothetical protein
MKDKPVELRSAMAELVALAVAVRTDWTAEQVQGALLNAKSNGFTWGQAIVGMARLMVDPQAVPAELVPPPKDPQRPWVQPPGAADNHRDELSAARVICAEATAKIRAAERGRVGEQP